MYKKWTYPPKPTVHKVDKLVAQLGLHKITAELLHRRGIDNLGAARLFLAPWEGSLHDASMMKDMEKGVKRLAQAIANKELIGIYGDYDVDGTSSVALLFQVLTDLGAYVLFYIPDRHKEGYGISLQGLNHMLTQQVQLLLCVDCGTKEIERINFLQQKGIDVIVCDHHEQGSNLPNAVAIINPKQKNCHYPFKELSACGIAYKLAISLVQEMKADPSHLANHLDLVVLSIAADLVPLIGENRLLAYQGLKILNKNPRKGLLALSRRLGKHGHLTTEDIAFGLAPCINAAGRIGHAQQAVWLFLTQDQEQANRWADKLYQQNKERKQLDDKITQEALVMIHDLNHGVNKDRYTNVLYKQGWHKGVLGIVASRCIEHDYKPTIILTGQHNECTGSARSVEGYDIHQALVTCSPWLGRYGGHAYAGGLNLPYKNIDKLKQVFEKTVANTLQQKHRIPLQHIDAIIPLEDLSIELYKDIKRLAPFGHQHPTPIFGTYPVVARKYWIHQNKHLKIHLQQKNSEKIWEAIGFGMAKYVPYINHLKPFAIAYTLNLPKRHTTNTLQLTIQNIQPVSNK